MPAWLTLCFTRPVVRRAVYSAVIVGTILVIINHGSAFLQGDVDRSRQIQIVLTYMVPYVVSTVSSVITIRELTRPG